MAQQKRVKESSKYLDEDEVACLPDTVVPVSLDPDSAGRARTLVLVDKLTQGRRERHRAAYEDMEQEVSLLGKVSVSMIIKRYKFRDLFRLCPPPPPVRYDPSVTEHVPLHSKSLCKNIARGSGCANYMHPLSWGGGGGAQTEKV